LIEMLRVARKRQSVPRSTVVVSAVALLIPGAAPFVAPGVLEQNGALLWLLALVPALLLSYHRGWSGAALALAAGMLVLTWSNVALLLLGVRQPNPALLLSVVGAYAAICIGFGYLAERLHQAREMAEHLALTDDVTGLPNRRYARLFLEKEFEAARRGRPLAVAVFDLDRFKEYNDRWGHAAGDQALRTFASVLAATTRRMNVSARVGGEEFLSIVSMSDEAGARIFADRVRAGLAAQQPRVGELRVSVGIAAFRADMASMDDLVAAADAALYAAKFGGRDAVCCAGDVAQPVPAA
jgi:diguanylate cyclase (GGDEF)-like protein